MITISPHDVRELIVRGAKLINIRDADEYPCGHVPEVDLALLSVLEQLSLPAKLCREQIISRCQAGKRTSNNADKLTAAVASAEIFLFEDGVDGWKGIGLPIAVNESQPSSLVRQMQIVMGDLALIGVVLGYTISSGFFLLNGFVDTGLLFTGISGLCGMIRLLDKMSWNQRA